MLARIFTSAAILTAVVSPSLAAEAVMTPAVQAALESAIRAKDFACPAVKIAIKKQPAARASIFKVYCGPTDGDDAIYTFAYRVTLPSNRSDKFLVEDW